MVCSDDEINMHFENVVELRGQSTDCQVSDCHSEINNTVNIVFHVSSLCSEVFSFVYGDALDSQV